MDDDLLLAASEAPLLETPQTFTDAANDSSAAVPAADESAAAAEEGVISLTPITPATQLIFLQIVLQLRALKFKKTVEVPAEESGSAAAASSTGAATTAEVWDTTTGPQLADALRRRVFKEMTGTGVAGYSSDTALVDSCVVDALRSFSKRLCRLDSTITPHFSSGSAAKGDRKKSRKEKKRGGDDSDDEEDERRKEKKAKKDKKKEKKSKKEKKQKRSKFIDDMAGESDESDY